MTFSTYDPSPPASEFPARLTRIAFVLLLVLPIVRVMMLEILRDPFNIAPGGQPVPRGPGPASTVILNLLCCTPALLVLLRRSLDATYRLRLDWSHLLLGLLATWTLASVFWADDKFAAVVSGSTFFAAATLIWAAVQLVRGWGEFRLVGAVCTGLLVVSFAYGEIYRFVEFPDLQRSWQQNKQSILRERGWAEDSFSAKQFAHRVESGELTGFTASPNTFGAIVVLTMLVAVGIGVQRSRDDGRAWLAFVAVALAAGFWLLVYTDSRTALATPFIGGVILLVATISRPWLIKHSQLALWLGVGVVLLGIAAIVGHGLSHGTLFHDSLTFRWKYWIGSAGVFQEHPLLGVGSYNFGQHYLAHRLPESAEEIKDPHNFLVRTFVELGAVGGFLIVAWLIRLWRELTRPVIPVPDDSHEPTSSTWTSVRFQSSNWGTVIPWLATVVAAATVLNVLLAVDWSQELSFIAVEVLKRQLYGLALVVGASAVALRSMQNPELDDRPSRWVLWFALASLGVFLVHNLVDFSLFEAGPMMLFAVLTGAALGVRFPESNVENARSRIVPSLVCVLATVTWIGTWIILAVPVTAAEQAANSGDDALRASRFYDASNAYDRAANWLPYNSDYTFRAARALLYARADTDQALTRLARAIDQNPSALDARMMRAEFYVNLRNINAAKEDYETIFKLNPNDVGTRLQFADALASFGRNEQAKTQIELALKYDDLLDAAEPKRLTAEKKAELRARLNALVTPALP